MILPIHCEERRDYMRLRQRSQLQYLTLVECHQHCGQGYNKTIQLSKSIKVGRACNPFVPHNGSVES